MRYKWIALVFVCALLFCSCRQVEMGGASDNVTTTTPTDTTTSNTTTTRPPNYTYDVSRPTTYALLTFPDLEKYTDTVKNFTDKQAIYDHLVTQDLKNKKIVDSELAILLEDKYFLVPQLREDCTYSEWSFSTAGQTTFTVRKKDDKDGYMIVQLYHNAKGSTPMNEKNYELTNARGITVTRYAFEYVWHEGDTPVYVSIQYPATEERIKWYEDFIRNLTFEKIEIK